MVMGTSSLTEIIIARDFTRIPGPRYKDEGDFSGQFFREAILAPQIAKAISEGGKLRVVLDGTEGYGTSFLEEAFGGLIREDKMNYQEICDALELVSTESEDLVREIEKDLLDAYSESTKG
jgi:hypothetical protein